MLFPAPGLPAATAEKQFEQFIESGGCLLMDGTAERAAYRSSEPFIPASTIKIATALAALETLGPKNRFTTGFYLRDETILVIKGYGDPFLLPESIPAIAEQLKKSDVRRISRIVLDGSFFRLEGPPPGSANSRNPYDARNAALAVSFNALPLVKEPDGSISSGEEQTPLLPLMLDIGASLAPGRYRVNVSAFPSTGATDNILRYAAELFIALFRSEGLEVADAYEAGTAADTDILLYTHRSARSTADVVRACLRYSNNFVANQLFLLSGASRFGPPATWSKGREAMRTFLQRELGPVSGEIRLVEGSGLSRHNRATARGMIALLDAFRPYAPLLPERNDLLLKSGTLSDVHNYAGYFRGRGGLDPFVILLNQAGNARDEVLALLRDIRRRPVKSGVRP